MNTLKSNYDCSLRTPPGPTGDGEARQRGPRGGILAILAIVSLVLTLNPAALAQGNSNAAHLRDLNGKVVHHHELVGKAAAGDKDNLRNQAAPDIQEREAALATLIETDPTQALELAFSSDLLDNLRASFPASAAHFERTGKWEGVLEYLIADDLTLKASKQVFRLKTAHETLRVHFSGKQPKLTSGMTLSLTGVAAGGAVAAAGDVAYASTGGLAGMACGLTGAQNVVTILVNLPGYTLDSAVDQELVKGILFGNASSSKQSTPDWSVDDFWQQNSDGQVSAPSSGGKVAGPYQLASNFNRDANNAVYCDYMGLSQAAINAADGDVNFQNFNRVVVVFPYNGACAWAGLSSVGCWTNSSPGDGSFTSSVSWLRSDQMNSRTWGVQLATHELGHGLGMNHASTRDFPGPPRQPLGAVATQGNLDEYGDTFSTMGSWNFGLYNAPHAQEILGWLGPSNYQVVSSPGQYSVQAYETRGASGMVKALKVLRDAATNSYVWVEYRTNTGIYDSQLNSQVWSGALIHYEDSFTNNHSHLIDHTSGTTVFTDPALAVGQTWVDPYSSLYITVNGITASTLNLTVNYGPPPCILANPSVTLSPLNPTVNGGSTTNYSVTLTNNESAACPSSTYNLTTAQPAGFSGTLSSSSISLAPGASGTVTLTETAANTSGTYPISVNATDAATPTYTGNGSANITVVSVCALANPSVTLAPSTATVAASGTATYTVVVVNNDTNACPSSTYSLAATQPSGITGTLSSTSLSLLPGGTGYATLTEKAGTTLGTYAISVKATDTATPTYTGTGAGSLVVAGCTLANPTVTLSPTTATVGPSGSSTYTISVLNNNSSACAAATYKLAATQPSSSFTGTLSATTVAIASGATGTATITERAGTTAGTFTFSVTATNSSSSTSTGKGSASIVVVSCTLANPTVLLSPSTASVGPSGSATYTVAVTNNNSAYCTATYTLAATQPNTSFSATLSPTSLSIASGATATATVTEKAGSTAGTFTFSVTATNSSSTTSKGAGAANIVVVPCTLANPTVTLAPATRSVNPSGTAAYTVAVTNNNSAYCTATYTLAATQPSSSFSATFSATSLTIAPGATGTATVTEKGGTTAGSFTFSVSATNSASSTSKGTASAGIVVVTPVVAVTTDATSYKPLSAVTMTAVLAGGTPISGATVKFTLTKPNATTATYSGTTDANGKAVWKYTLVSTDPNGTYKVSAVATTLTKATYTSPTITFPVGP